MGDHFEMALKDIARRSNGGGKTIDDLFDLTVAANEDAEERHEEHTGSIGDLCSRTVALEAFAEESRTTCKERIERLIHEEHEARHSRHMMENHPEGDFRNKLVWWTATATGRVILVLFGLVAGLVLQGVWSP